MEMLVVQGGSRLRGCVTTSGAKNASLPIMAAALAVSEPVTLRNVPHLVDVSTLSQVLQTLGLSVERTSCGDLELAAESSLECTAHYDLVRKMRAGVCVLGPLLGRRGRACVSLPGGCNIGHRPIDLHLKGLAALGADVRIERGYVFAEAKQLRGADIYLGGPFGSTVTGTCNVMSAAVLARGVTTISAAACEPEVVDLGHFLNACGAKIEGLGTPLLRIEGVAELGGTTHDIIPDRIEAATLLIAAAMTDGQVCVEGARPEHLRAVIDALQLIGVEIESTATSITVRGASQLLAVDLAALPYPGLPTDVQAQFTALLCRAEGISAVTDKVFPDRFLHLPELMRLGAKVRREGATGIIRGVPRLSGACVMASDLRASAGLIIAALAADGYSVIRRIYHLDRGYENLEQKLTTLGATIERVTDDATNVPACLRSSFSEADGTYRVDAAEGKVGPHVTQSERVLESP